jgi:hypothetical protein
MIAVKLNDAVTSVITRMKDNKTKGGVAIQWGFNKFEFHCLLLIKIFQLGLL